MVIHFSVGYDSESPLVRECDLRIDEGRVTSIVGDNGCGKSTVYRTLAGEMPPLSGAVPGDLPGRCCTVSDRSKIPSEVLVGDIVDLVGEAGMARLRSRSRMIADVVEGLSGTRVSRLSTGQPACSRSASASPRGGTSSYSTRRSAASTTGAARRASTPCSPSRGRPSSRPRTTSRTSSPSATAFCS